MTDLYRKMRAFQKVSGSQRPIQSPPETKPANPVSSSLSALSQIPGVTLARELVRKIEKREQERDTILASFGGHECETRAGRYWFRHTVIPASRLAYSENDLDAQTLRRLGRDETLVKFDPRNAVFVDTETTGLAGGTGTYAFLVGIGRFTDEGMSVTQYLMRDYDEEPAMLDAIQNDLSSASALVTFNGKCFDIPLLVTRFQMNRFPATAGSLSHFDLLPPARRLWRRRCDSCTLGNLEAILLGHTRPVDVPGYMIPQIYFDFIRGIAPHRMRPVLEHNVEDIVSLAMLTAKACRLYRSPESEAHEPLDWYALGRSFMGDGHQEMACLCLERSLRAGLPLELRWTAQRDYSLLLKRKREYTRAVEVWREMLNNGAGPHPFPYEELAKYYEHVERQPGDALRLVQEFLRWLDSGDFDDSGTPVFHVDRVRAEFDLRLKRLRRKADTCNRGK